MARVETSITIDKPLEDVFAFLGQAENHRRFIPGMLEFKQTSAGSLGQVGATARGVRSDFGLKTPVLYEITEYEPNRTLGMKGVMGPILFRDGYVLDRQGSATRVNFWLELTFMGLAKLAQPLVFLIGKTHAGETLANLKKEIEAG
jgi:carbon monoxide dehydrogenase subunit G